MDITSSYAVEILKDKKIFKATVNIYRAALSYCIEAFNKEWSDITSIKGELNQFCFAERLIHSTKNNMAKYDFDSQFVKFPSYLRRAVTQAALGAVSSYQSNLQKWKSKGRKGSEPRLQLDRYSMPCFYNKGMFISSKEDDSAYLKLYINNDWVWYKVKLLHTDVRYLQKRWKEVEPSTPTLEKRYGKYYLRFAFKQNIELSKESVEDQLVCSVDLGLNSDAVCSIMTSNGTVLARKFINFSSEKDHLYTVLNRIKKQQRKLSSQSAKGFWKYATHLNNELAKKISNAITDFAVLYSVDVIVFEYLDFKGKKVKGSKKQKFQLWRKNGIQHYTEHKAHRSGIRISHICARGTSKLAFDGSGKLERNENNHALATFSSGKQYNCDLSASYNIGARYFIREILKPLPVTVKSQLQAKVPEVERRTLNTLSTLKKVVSELSLMSV